MASLRIVRLVLAVMVAFVTASVAATPSLAAVCEPSVLYLPAGLACAGFDLQVQISPSCHYVDKKFYDKAGNLVRVLGAGKGNTLTFTNVSSGATLTTPPNGSVSNTWFNPDGSSTVLATGHNVIILFPTDVPAGPSTTLYVGQVLYTVDTSGVFTIMKVSGKTTDICAALSG